MALDQDVRELATRPSDPNFAALTTLFDDGQPQTQLMWVDADDEHLLLNTEVHRQKYRNVEEDDRVAVTIWDRDNPYAYAEVRGRVVETSRGDEAREHIDAVSRRYTGGDYPNPVESERVILRVQPERVNKAGV